LKDDIFKNIKYAGNSLDNSYGFWNAGFDYKLTKDLTFGGVYVKSDAETNNATINKIQADSNEAKSYSVQLTYKAAQAKVAGSYGAWLAYRQLGSFATINTTFVGAETGTKGYELGLDYMLDKNILAKTVYYDGENITGGKDIKKVFERLEFAF
jgi:predicted porin